MSNEGKGNAGGQCSAQGSAMSAGSTGQPSTSRRVRIAVEPLFNQGNQVICAIDPQTGNAKGGMIKLPRGHSYTLEFELQSVGSSAPQVTFSDDPFWCKADDCPNNSQLNGQYQNPRVTNGGRTLEVDVTPSSSPNAIHYRLNFDPRGHFDPIIIHD